MTIPEGFLEYYLQASREIQSLLRKYGYNPKAKGSQIILLGKALYGLKQAPREWQQLVIELLKKLGYKPLLSDSAVYYSPETGIFIPTHVDDCLLIGPSLASIKSLKKKIHSVYEIEDRGPAAFFLGVQIVRNRKKRRLWLHQTQYIEEALEHFNLEEPRPIQTPLQTGLVSNTEANNSLKPADYTILKLYQSIIGTVMYCMTQTRPDIAFSVQWLSRFLIGPS